MNRHAKRFALLGLIIGCCAAVLGAGTYLVLWQEGSDPRRVTQTFGKSTRPAAADRCGTTPGYKVAFRHLLPEAGRVTSLHIYLNGLRRDSSDQPIEGVIYDDDGVNGTPHTLLASSETILIPNRSPFRWFEFPLPAPVSLKAGKYYLGFVMRGDTTAGLEAPGEYLCEVTVGAQHGNVDANESGAANRFGIVERADYSASIYATYERVESSRSDSAMGPLRVLPSNPRYFTADGVSPVYLTGSHTWWNLVDGSPTDPPAPFDFTAYLRDLEEWQHNFIRLWAWDLTRDTVLSEDEAPGAQHRAPQPFARTGPEDALDDKPKFDLSRLDGAYFERLRERVREARDTGIYVSIMLFEGYGADKGDLPFAYESHPFASENNVNGIDGDPNDDGRVREVYQLPGEGGLQAVNDVQKRYIRAVIDAVNEFDNVLYEISNEAPDATTGWQYDMIEYVRSYEATLAKQHPVGMTFQWEDGNNEALFASPADWISPQNPLDDPPPATGAKVIVSDTDHHCGYCNADAEWAWKEFTRGRNPIFMDPYGTWRDYPFDKQEDVSARTGMGQTLRYSRRMDLTAAEPRGDVSSTGYALVNQSSSEYLVYQPGDGPFVVSLDTSIPELAVEWLEPSSDTTHVGARLAQGGRQTFTPPFDGPAVLYLRPS